MSLQSNSVLVAAAAAVVLGGVNTANAVVVAGTSDPWLAGMPDGSTASSGDVAPAESPVLVPGLTLSAGEDLNFSVTGSVSHIRTPSGDPPDGGAFVSHSAGAQNGIAGLTAPFNSLIGVFLSASQPSLSPAPAGLNFRTIGASFAALSPVLQQPFFIGDGLTGNGTGSVQNFVVPAGATRLFLGTMDEYGWYDNSGSFAVNVTIGGVTPPPPPVPEPATLPMLAGVLGAFFFLRRRGSPARD